MSDDKDKPVIVVNERTIQSMAQTALRAAIQGRIDNAIGARLSPFFPKLIQAEISSAQLVLSEAIKNAILEALETKEFKDAVREELLGSLRAKFRGEFMAVTKAAAKTAASNEHIAMKVAEFLKNMDGDSK